MTSIRLLSPADADEVTALLLANRAFLAPWEPARAEGWFTAATQRAVLERSEQEHAAGRHVPWGIVADDGALVGRINLNDIVRGAFESAHLGYWVAQTRGRSGVATRAAALAIDAAFTEYGLHRIQAGTLLHNVGSQKVLERNGFERFGMAPRYLRIGGKWQDHVLYQRLAE